VVPTALAVSLTVIGVSCTGLPGGLGTLAALIALGGLGSGMMHPEAGKYAAMLSGSRRSGGISIFQIGGQIGYALGPLVAAALVQRAIGSRLTCVFVDHGLLRQGEAEQVEQDFVAATGVDLHVEDAGAEFLGALASVADPEEKRKIIGREFIRAFERATAQITAIHNKMILAGSTALRSV